MALARMTDRAHSLPAIPSIKPTVRFTSLPSPVYLRVSSRGRQSIKVIECCINYKCLLYILDLQ